ncbi:HAMP domain-containing sensor histidine kinase [Streptacidiphilus sp. P02-A3a]|uniref:sensor histidine kinase n=1 Tax=Streptacidiphilus sp. P02-A3a TaxID=2704468 RepID=UPI0015FE7065|nr:HAMP domain-containing sensor histidine kinase [Streptacidiphilus sp. P02-A3a]QMU72633.1 HAMP domain-containing histidine kinase [Streptacidiphilus sp. P02-A3a]
MRLSTRIALVTTALVPVLVLLSGLLLLGLVSRDLHAGQDAQLRQRTAAALPDARVLLRAADTGHQRQEANQQHRIISVALDVGVRLTATDGTVVISEGGQPAPDVVLPTATGNPVTLHGGGTWRALGQSVAAADGQRAGTLWLFSPASAVRTEVASVRGRIVLVALIAAPIGGLLAFGIAERAVRPLRQLQRRTSGLDPDDPATRLEHRPTRVAEVDDLARTLQSVLERYDEQAARTGEALETARAFAASASHELRTPLMSMRTNLDVLAHPGLTAPDRAEVLDDLQAEHARLLGLLTALRSLAQGDLVQADAFTRVDLAELVEAAVADVRRRAPRAAVTVSSPASLPLPGWEPGLRMLVDNLLSNALVHGTGPGRSPRLAVSLGRDGGQALLTVDDTGPGVPPDQRQAVFARFRRGPDSPGSGLGLTLVAQQVALHVGTVRITDPPSGQGARVEVRLPLAADRSATATLALRRDWLSG